MPVSTSMSVSATATDCQRQHRKGPGPEPKAKSPTFTEAPWQYGVDHFVLLAARPGFLSVAGSQNPWSLSPRSLPRPPPRHLLSSI